MTIEERTLTNEQLREALEAEEQKNYELREVIKTIAHIAKTYKAIPSEALKTIKLLISSKNVKAHFKGGDVYDG